VLLLLLVPLLPWALLLVPLLRMLLRHYKPPAASR
jgi:hypothetical protein